MVGGKRKRAALSAHIDRTADVVVAADRIRKRLAVSADGYVNNRVVVCKTDRTGAERRILIKRKRCTARSGAKRDSTRVCTVRRTHVECSVGNRELSVPSQRPVQFTVRGAENRQRPDQFQFAVSVKRADFVGAAVDKLRISANRHQLRISERLFIRNERRIVSNVGLSGIVVLFRQRNCLSASNSKRAGGRAVNGGLKRRVGFAAAVENQLLSILDSYFRELECQPKTVGSSCIAAFDFKGVLVLALCDRAVLVHDGRGNEVGVSDSPSATPVIRS